MDSNAKFVCNVAFTIDSHDLEKCAARHAKWKDCHIRTWTLLQGLSVETEMHSKEANLARYNIALVIKTGRCGVGHLN